MEESWLVKSTPFYLYLFMVPVYCESWIGSSVQVHLISSHMSTANC